MFQSTPDSLDPQALLDELYPLCRSLSGYGYDQSLDILSRYILKNPSNSSNNQYSINGLVTPSVIITAAHLHQNLPCLTLWQEAW